MLPYCPITSPRTLQVPPDEARMAIAPTSLYEIALPLLLVTCPLEASSTKNRSKISRAPPLWIEGSDYGEKIILHHSVRISERKKYNGVY